MLNRTDVERIVENVLKELSISVVDYGFTENMKEVVLKYKDVVISTTAFSITPPQE